MLGIGISGEKYRDCLQGAFSLDGSIAYLEEQNGRILLETVRIPLCLMALLLFLNLLLAEALAAFVLKCLFTSGYTVDSFGR